MTNSKRTQLTSTSHEAVEVEMIEWLPLLVPMEHLLEALDVPNIVVRRESRRQNLSYRGSGSCPLHEGSRATDFSWNTDGAWHCSVCRCHGDKIDLVRALIKEERKILAFLAKVAAQVSPFNRFVQYCAGNEATRKLLARLSNAGCNEHFVFNLLRRYLENPEDSRARRKALGLKFRSRINRYVRKGPLPREHGEKLLARTRVFDIKRLGVAHLTPCLYGLAYYIETKTGKWPSADDLYLLIEAARIALMRWRLTVTPDAVRHELARFMKRNDSHLVPLIENYIRTPYQELWY